MPPLEDFFGAVGSGISSYLNYDAARDANNQNKDLYYDNRNYMTELANTAHQREVKDLIAAGLNPILSVNRSGSGTPSSAAPVMQNVMRDAVSSANEGFRTYSEHRKRQDEREAIQQQISIKKPVATGAGLVDRGLGAVGAAGDGLTEIVRAAVGAAMDHAPAVSGAAQQAMGAASATTAAAVEKIEDVAREYGARVSEVIANPSKFVSGVASSAWSAIKPYTVVPHVQKFLDKMRAKREPDIKGDSPANYRYYGQ